ncbi:MAG: hypothetical protein NC123_20220, partial [Butyrivibrio sp.]|nr:hypothetical protein [Butyrivibrio sp.]
MREDIARIIASTITILLIIGIIKLILFIFRILKKILSTLFSIPTKGFQYKNTSWNDIDRLVLHTKARVQFPRSQYQPNPMYCNAFMNNPYDPVNTQNMVINIMEHAGYQGPIPEVTYIQYGNKPSSHSINGRLNPAQIQIVANPNISSADLLVLMIHECMHVYDAYYRVEYG